jgi:uncharacterized protein YjiS (DUF1127 family)
MSLINLFVAARAALAGRRQRRRAYDELAALDDRSLADIGVHRSQLAGFVTRLQDAEQPVAAPKPAAASAVRKGAPVSVPQHRLRGA